MKSIVKIDYYNTAFTSSDSAKVELTCIKWQKPIIYVLYI